MDNGDSSWVVKLETLVLSFLWRDLFMFKSVRVRIQDPLQRAKIFSPPFSRGWGKTVSLLYKCPDSYFWRFLIYPIICMMTSVSHTVSPGLSNETKGSQCDYYFANDNNLPFLRNLVFALRRILINMNIKNLTQIWSWFFEKIDKIDFQRENNNFQREK